MARYNSPLGKRSLFYKGDEDPEPSADFQSPLKDSLFDRPSAFRQEWEAEKKRIKTGENQTSKSPSLQPTSSSEKGELKYFLAIRNNGGYLLTAEWQPHPFTSTKRDFKDRSGRVLGVDSLQKTYYWHVYINGKTGKIELKQNYSLTKVIRQKNNLSYGDKNEEFVEISKIHTILSLEKAYPTKLYEISETLKEHIQTLNPKNILPVWKHGLSRFASSDNILNYAPSLVGPTLLNMSLPIRGVATALSALNLAIKIYDSTAETIEIDAKAFKHRK